MNIYDGCERWKGENKDCTVRATACLLDISYDQAHAMLEGWGRKPKKGFTFWTVAEKFGLIERKEFQRRRVKTVLGLLPAGRFVIRVPGHVFAVVDGKPVSDPHPPRPFRIVSYVLEYPRSERLPVLRNKI